MICLDLSALVKLIHPEQHSDTLAAWLAARPGQFAVASALAGAETSRALWRSDPQALPRVPAVLARLFLLPVDARILELAGALADPMIQTLDAIHLATAQALGAPQLTFVTYDQRLHAAAAAGGLDVAAPGT